jgi:hypothetical protein
VMKLRRLQWDDDIWPPCVTDIAPLTPVRRDRYWRAADSVSMEE